MRPVHDLMLDPVNGVARDAFDRFSWENVSHALSQCLEVKAARLGLVQLVMRRQFLRTLVGSPWALVRREWMTGKRARAAELVGFLLVPRAMFFVRRAFA